ncbi:hypothetical protein BH11PLA1_BH11PLA1_10680 [soil metagenome]
MTPAPIILRIRPLTIAVLGLTLAAGAASAAVITVNTFVGPFDTTYDNQPLIIRGCTVTMRGTHAFDSLTIERGTAGTPGTLTHNTDPGEPGFTLNIAHAVTVQGSAGGAASAIDATGRGYAPGFGYGLASHGFYTPGSTHAGGGGHGGPGANSAAPVGFGGTPYDSATAPAIVGAGGGADPADNGTTGGAGGGIIRITSGGPITVDGAILADGAAGIGPETGGGAGGSIWLTAPTISGSGLVAARGAPGCCAYAGGGGGGRIRLETCAPVTMVVSVAALGPRPGGEGSISTQVSSPSYFVADPASAVICRSGSHTFTPAITPGASPAIEWEWSCSAQPAWTGISNNVLPTGQTVFSASNGATPALQVFPPFSDGVFNPSARGLKFRCVIVSPCGRIVGGAAALVVKDLRCQAADIAWDDGTPLTPFGDCGAERTNNGVNEGDYNCFFNFFFSEQYPGAPADIASDNGTPLPPFGSAVSNSGVNEGDYNCFFNNFFDGCAA